MYQILHVMTFMHMQLHAYQLIDNLNYLLTEVTHIIKDSYMCII